MVIFLWKPNARGLGVGEQMLGVGAGVGGVCSGTVLGRPVAAICGNVQEREQLLQ